MEKQEAKDFLAQNRTHLANERTLLAYWRTTLAFLALGVLLVKSTSSDYSPILILAATLLGIILFVFSLVHFLKYREKINSY
jgi:putative membrane protein